MVLTPQTEVTFSSQFCNQGALLYLTACLTQIIPTMTASSIPMTGMGTWPFRICARLQQAGHPSLLYTVFAPPGLGG